MLIFKHGPAVWRQKGQEQTKGNTSNHVVSVDGTNYNSKLNATFSSYNFNSRGPDISFSAALIHEFFSFLIHSLDFGRDTSPCKPKILPLFLIYYNYEYDYDYNYFLFFIYLFIIIIIIIILEGGGASRSCKLFISSKRKQHLNLSKCSVLCFVFRRG